jgi:hypothetical protein
MCNQATSKGPYQHGNCYIEKDIHFRGQNALTVFTIHDNQVPNMEVGKYLQL